MLNFINDYSGMAWIYLLKKKSDALNIFREWKALVENETGERVKMFRTDNGGKYTSGSLLNTYVTKVSATKPLHHTHQLKMANPSDYTEQL